MTIKISDVSFNSSYNFIMTVPSVMTNAFNNALVVGIGGYDVAKNVSTDVYTEHISQLASLPAGTNKDPTALTYLIIKTNTGAKRALALDWISSVTLIQSVNATINITNTDQETLALITAYIASLGVTYTQS